MKQTVILVPGLLCDAFAWDAQIKALTPHATIIVPDLNQVNTPTEMVRCVLKNAPDTFALAGHSMGGWVALEVMRHHADRVNKLFLANTCATLDTNEKEQARKDMIADVKSGKSNHVIDRLANAFVYNKEYAPSVKDMLTRNISAFINQETAMLARKDCTPILPNITCTTTVLYSDHDLVFSPTDAKIMSDNINHSKLVAIDNAGHMSLMEKPEEVNKHMLDWLNQE